jgi:hypothetical protein
MGFGNNSIAFYQNSKTISIEKITKNNFKMANERFSFVLVVI